MDSTLWSRTPLASRPSRYDTGAFATEDLDEGTVVIPKWNESFCDGMEGWVRLDRRQVQQLPRDAKQLFLRYGLDTDFDQIIGPVDINYVTTPDNFITGFSVTAWPTVATMFSCTSVAKFASLNVTV